jgi:hypothetical protein
MLMGSRDPAAKSIMGEFRGEMSERVEILRPARAFHMPSLHGFSGLTLFGRSGSPRAGGRDALPGFAAALLLLPAVVGCQFASAVPAGHAFRFRCHAIHLSRR